MLARSHRLAMHGVLRAQVGASNCSVIDRAFARLEPIGDDGRHGGASAANSLNRQRHSFHSTKRVDNPVIIGGVAVLTAAIGAQYMLDAYNKSQASKLKGAAEEEQDTGEENKTNTSDTIDENMTQASRNQAQQRTTSRNGKAAGKGVAGGEDFDAFMGDLFGSFGGNWKETKAGFFAKNFYDGGFDDKMTKREAALILGVRESSTPNRIKECHRRILLINHPDRGGSPYVAAKINEAKDLLLKGKKK